MISNVAVLLSAAKISAVRWLISGQFMIHPDRQSSPKLLAHHDFKVVNQSSHPAALRSNERLVIDMRVTDKYVMVIDGNKGHSRNALKD